MSENASHPAYDAWLASACMPSSVIRRLLETYGDAVSVHRALTGHSGELNKLITPRFALLLRQNASEDSLEHYDRVMEKHQIRTLCLSDQAFPEALRQISDPPAILFFQGELTVLKRRTIAMVGSRAASYVGQKAARSLSTGLSRKGIVVISGLAAGIDSCAHLGCLDGGSPTAAVTACGLDIVYPKSNLALRDRILQNGGLILSEYAPGERPSGWHFPVRNRIITGLSHALVLIEARIRSGSMTSVQHALDQGKDVFVYPGDPSSAFFEGNHQLLREGGIYFTSAEDILSDLHWLDNPVSVGQNSVCLTGKQERTAEEKAVIHALNPGALHFEELLSRTGLDASSLLACLTMLQISGCVEALPGKLYQLKNSSCSEE